jgi:hypothetical protein
VLEHVATRGLSISDRLEAAIRDGFGSEADGEDRFDAVVDPLGMMEVALKRRPSGEPPDAGCEGWILGQGPQAMKTESNETKGAG